MLVNLGIMLEYLGKQILDLLFPQRCLGCGREGSLLCPACCQSLPRLSAPRCARCDALLSPGVPSCRCESLLPHIDGIRSLFSFEGVMRQAIHKLKYQNLRAIAAPLGQLLGEYLVANPLPGEVLVAVPLYQKRLRERGYNQSLLLAKELGKAIHILVVEEALLRLRNTPPQAKTASASERRANVQAAFACNEQMRGKRVLLIDDVCTTGATLDACAAALKAAGAASVWGITVAREK